MQTDLSDFEDFNVEDFNVEDFDFFPPREDGLGNPVFIPRFSSEDFLSGEIELFNSPIAVLGSPDSELDEPRLALELPELDTYNPSYLGLPSEDPLFLPEDPEIDNLPFADRADDLPLLVNYNPYLVDDPSLSISDDLNPVFGSSSDNPLLTSEDLEFDDLPFAVPGDEPTLPVNNDPPIFNPINIISDDVGTSENDFIIGSTTSDDIDGLGGNDVIYGFGGNDSLTGGAGDDRLIGTSLTDLYADRREYDSLSGGIGADEFVLGDRNGAYYTGDGYARIWDFSAVAGDSIQLTGSVSEYDIDPNSLGNTTIFRGSDLIAIVYDTDVIPSTSLDFV